MPADTPLLAKKMGRRHSTTWVYVVEFVAIVILGQSQIVQGAQCGGSDYLGTTSVSSVANTVETTSGRNMLMTDSEYITPCCGFVTEWTIYAGSTGTIYFQVWRPSGGSYTLVGENEATVSATGTFTLTVSTANRIGVQSNDVIGWYTSGSQIVSSKTGGIRNDNNYYEAISQPSVGDTVTFTNTRTGRTYAIYAGLDNSAPTFSNLDATTSMSKISVSASSVVFTVTATDTDTSDTITYSVQSISPSNHFTVDSTSGDVSASTSSVSATTYTIVIRATDACGATTDGTLTLTLTNDPPVINSLPDVATLSESAVDEALLHTVNVTDPGDTVTCSLTSSPAGPFTTKFVISGGTLTTGVYVQSNPSFNYNTANTYELTITCTDTSSDSDSGILYVYITQNAVPVISNLQNSTSFFSNLSVSTTVFNVLASDVEGDQILFSLACVTVVSTCPLSIYSDGAIILTTPLIGSSINVYEVDVTVSDAYSSSGTHRLTCYVVDLNVAPSLTNLPASIQVTEDTGIGTVVFDTAVYDDNGDTSITFTATFSPSSSAALFSINASTGEITVADNLNFLTQVNNYTITVQVSDGSLASTSQTLQIETVDVNRAPILYQTNYQVEVSEGAAGTVFPDPGYNVYDADGDTLTYAFGGGNQTSGFLINSTTGIISYAINFDIDDTSTTPTSSFIWLITISDPNGLSTTATLTVSILDANDNVPEFTSTYYSVSVASNAPVGTIILTVSSTDADATSVNRRLEYSMHNTDEFEIDNSGNIFVYKSLLTLFDTTESCFIRVKNPDVSGQDTAYVNIYIYSPESDGYFDNPANIAWVTLTCIMAPLLLAGLGFLAYRYVVKPLMATPTPPPKQVAPFDTKMPPSRPVSQWSADSKSRPVSQRSLLMSTPSRVSPSDIRVIDEQWQAWNMSEGLWKP